MTIFNDGQNLQNEGLNHWMGSRVSKMLIDEKTYILRTLLCASGSSKLIVVMA